MSYSYGQQPGQASSTEQQIAAYYAYMNMSSDASVQNAYANYYGYGQSADASQQTGYGYATQQQYDQTQWQSTYSQPQQTLSAPATSYTTQRPPMSLAQKQLKKPKYNPLSQYQAATTSAPQATAANPYPPSIPVEKKPPPGKFFCDLCECYCNDQHAYMLHLNGKKHLSHLRRAGKAPPAPGQQIQAAPDIAPKPAKMQKTSQAPSTASSPPQQTPEDILVNTKHNDLTPISAHAVAIASLVQIAVTALGQCGDLGVDKVVLVGSYTKGVMLRDHIVADVTAVLTLRPTVETRNQIEQRVQTSEAVTTSTTNTNILVKSEKANILINDSTGVTVKIMLTWPGALKETEPSTEEEIPLSECQIALAAVHHVQWYNERNVSPNVRNCIRLMKYYKMHTPYWQALNPWALEVLVEKTLSLTGTATIARSIRSIFEFISAGALLPGGYGLPDPCSYDDESEPSPKKGVDLAAALTNEQRDNITKNAQDTLRSIAFGNWQVVVGLN